jgi:hypothetical protein
MIEISIYVVINAFKILKTEEKYIYSLNINLSGKKISI